MENKELNNIIRDYNSQFSNLKIYESLTPKSGISIGHKVYESLSGDYYYKTIIPYSRAHVEDSGNFKLVEL